MAAILETRSLSKSFGALAAVKDVSLGDRGRQPALDHRAERRRQDHALQPADRDVPADVGKNSSRSKGHHRHAGAPHRPPRPRALVPAHQRVPGILAARQRLGGRIRHRPLVERLALQENRQVSGGHGARAPGACGRRPRRKERPSRARDLARRAAPARACHRPRRARRACCCSTSPRRAFRPRRRAGWWRWCAR